MTIRTAVVDRIAVIEIARPEKKNALTLSMYQAMADALQRADADERVRAVLITGQPRIFTSGNDLEDLARHEGSLLDSPIPVFMQALIDCRKPVVAAVTGAAMGIGTTMLLHCDLVYVSDEARLCMPFVSLGLVPEFGSTLLVPLLMGQPKTTERLLLGDPFTAQEAVDSGLANAVLPADEVLGHARRMAERFNHLPPQAVQDTKRLLRAPLRAQLESAMREESALFAQKLGGAEAREAITAFFQRRKPDFSRLA